MVEAEQHEYVVDIGGLPHTFLLTKQQAKERGLSDADLVSKQRPAPSNKARSVSNK